jgi:truncated hemoglobin YjbI
MIVAAPVKGIVARIGGPERLREILERFYAKLFEDPMVGFFFAGKSLDAIVAGQLGFLLWAFGAKPELESRHPREAHADLRPILRGHFDRRLVVLREVLTAEGLAPDDVDAWLRVEESMRPHVQGTESGTFLS